MYRLNPFYWLKVLLLWLLVKAGALNDSGN